MSFSLMIEYIFLAGFLAPSIATETSITASEQKSIPEFDFIILKLLKKALANSLGGGSIYSTEYELVVCDFLEGGPSSPQSICFLYVISLQYDALQYD